MASNEKKKSKYPKKEVIDWKTLTICGMITINHGEKVPSPFSPHWFAERLINLLSCIESEWSVKMYDKEK